MTNEQQPEALRLAGILGDHYFYADTNEAAAELRRLHDENKLLKATQYGSGRLQELRDVRDKLHAENEDFRATIDYLTRENAEQIGEIVALKEQRDELLEALEHIEGLAMADDWRDLPEIVRIARAAITKGEKSAPRKNVWK